MPQDVFEDSLPPDAQGRNRLNGPLNHRRDDFPSAIQHDSVLHPAQCGGPLVDISGKVVGINVARADRTVTYAVPGEPVIALVKKVKARRADQESP